MPPDALALYAAVILLLPMACFFLSTPTFLLVGLEIPEVTQLLRGLFNGYFLVMGVPGSSRRWALSWRGARSSPSVRSPSRSSPSRPAAGFCSAWTPRCRPATPASPRRCGGFASCIWKGMLVNVVQLAVVVASVPLIV